MREQKDPLLRRRVESGDEVPEWQRVSACSDVAPALYHDRIRTLPQQAVEPVSHLPVRLGTRNSRPESHLGLDVPKGCGTVELPGWTRLVPTGGEREDGKDGKEGKGRKAHGAYGLWTID
jgi:hypothetical protein